MIKIGILASHNGSGFEAIHKACLQKRLNAEVTLVISNNTNAVALQKAQKYGLKNALVNSKTDDNPDEKIYSLLKEHDCEYVFLSGYMKKISPKITNNFKLINSHPALLPNYGGAGMYGRFVHEAVIKNGEKVSGVTIHEVNENYDEGKVILQKELRLSENETVETLETKIKELEQIAIIEALQNV
ncbi:MAG: phosphoribosylglycinamide formyltransferase [Campylobacterota bacterium]|nr:phosphoribosylglycinamide formyltransferase [Campylobacterota bacterium]